MIFYLAQSVIILSIFFFVYIGLLKRFTFFNLNRFFLLGGILLALISPIIPIGSVPIKKEYVYLPQSLFTENLEATTENSRPSFSISEWLINLSFTEWLISIYWIGVLFFVVLMLVQIISVLRLIRKGKSEYKEGVKFILTHKNISPFSFFSSIILNQNQLNGKQWDDVVTHEKVHISQWHQLDVFLSEFIKIILWFLPVSWWYAKQVRTNLEYIADDISLQNGLNAKQYQLSLVSISQQKAGPQIVNSFSKKIIKNRIKMLNTMKTNKKVVAIYGIVFPALLLCSLFVSKQAAAQEKKVEKIIVITPDQEVEKEDVKVMLKDDNGNYKEMEQDVEVDIVSVPNDSIIKKIINKDGTEIRIKNNVISFDSDSVFMKDGIAKLNNSDNTLLFKLGEGDINFEKLKNLDSLDVKLDILMDGSESDIMLFEFNSDEKLNISEKEYEKLSKRQQKRLDKIQEEIEKIREENPNSKVLKSYSIYDSNASDKSGNYKSSYSYSFKTDNNVEIRNTLNNNISAENPLIVLDGETISREEVKSVLSDNITEINVLKGNAATSVYGKQAKDGVIIITTK